MDDCGITATATPLPAEPSLRPLPLDAPMKLIGPLVGHGWFKLGFVGWGVGACPHEGVNLLTGGRLAALQGQAFSLLLWRRPACWPA